MAQMATTSQIPVEEYLRTAYEPDAEYVDGEIEERNVGEYSHSAVQKALLIWFYLRGKTWKVDAIQEQRIRLSPTRFRIPDVCVFWRDLPIEQVFTKPPLICIEVLSPEDRHGRMEERMEDFRRFGVAHLWVIDPKTQNGWDVSAGDWIRTKDFRVEGTEIRLSLPELFASMAE
jgi:Uma2 family endonuclease